MLIGRGVRVVVGRRARCCSSVLWPDELVLSSVLWLEELVLSSVLELVLWCGATARTAPVRRAGASWSLVEAGALFGAGARALLGRRTRGGAGRRLRSIPVALSVVPDRLALSCPVEPGEVSAVVVERRDDVVSVAAVPVRVDDLMTGRDASEMRTGGVTKRLTGIAVGEGGDHRPGVSAPPERRERRSALEQRRGRPTRIGRQLVQLANRSNGSWPTARADRIRGEISLERPVSHQVRVGRLGVEDAEDESCRARSRAPSRSRHGEPARIERGAGSKRRPTSTRTSLLAEPVGQGEKQRVLPQRLLVAPVHDIVRIDGIGAHLDDADRGRSLRARDRCVPSRGRGRSGGAVSSRREFGAPVRGSRAVPL